MKKDKMHFKIRLFLVIIFVVIFQFILVHYFQLHLDNPIWWIITLTYTGLQPFWQNPLANWLDFQITLYRERRERRRKYREYQVKVKAGSVPVKDFETEAKRVIK